MKKWWNWVLAVALLSLLFIAIPLTYSGGKNTQQLKLTFDKYIEKFNKSYKNDPEEYEKRFKHFLVNLEEIDKLNAESRGSEDHRARFGLTRLSDMSKDEYKEIHLSDEKLKKSPHLYGKSWHQYKDNKRRTIHDEDKKRKDDDVEGPHHEYHDYKLIRKRRATLPLSFDWRKKGVVGAVRDQGLCGACWAFSTVGIMETMAAIKSGKLVSLSVQEVIDCAGLGNSGCAGGDICLLLDWLTITKTAVETDKQYPLKLTNGICRINKTVSGVRVNTFTCDSFVGLEDQILEAIATHGPVAVAVNALTWQNYLGGVIQYHCSGAPADLNHAVQLVGYDLTTEVPYYIAKNSWGEEFGNAGYIHLAIGSNICGLANEVASVDVV